MIGFVGAALVLGLSSGLSPGPLSALVIAQTIKYGAKEGIKVSVTPLVTDIPIICIAVFLLSSFAYVHNVLGWISIAGGSFLIYLAWETFRATPPEMNAAGRQVQSLGKGIAVNALNPHPYLFWITVGAPIIIKAYQESLAAAAAFILCFLFSLVGTKVFITVVVDRTKTGSGRKSVSIHHADPGISSLCFRAFSYQGRARSLKGDRQISLKAYLPAG